MRLSEEPLKDLPEDPVFGGGGVLSLVWRRRMRMCQMNRLGWFRWGQVGWLAWTGRSDWGRVRDSNRDEAALVEVMLPRRLSAIDSSRVWLVRRSFERGSLKGEAQRLNLKIGGSFQPGVLRVDLRAATVWSKTEQRDTELIWNQWEQEQQKQAREEVPGLRYSAQYSHTHTHSY